MTTLKERIEYAAGAGSVIEDCDMRRFTSFRAGGRAELLVMPRSVRALREVLKILADSGKNAWSWGTARIFWYGMAATGA